jgi:hypothetical protein
LGYLPTLKEIVPLLQVNKATNALLRSDKLNYFWFTRFDALYRLYSTHQPVAGFHQLPSSADHFIAEENTFAGLDWPECRQVICTSCEILTGCEYSDLRQWLIVLCPHALHPNEYDYDCAMNRSNWRLPIAPNFSAQMWTSLLRCKNEKHYMKVSNPNTGVNYYESVNYFLRYRQTVFEWLFDWNNGKYKRPQEDSTDLYKDTLKTALLMTEDPLNTVFHCATKSIFLPLEVVEEMRRLHEEMNEIRQSLKQQEESWLSVIGFNK